MRVLLPPRDGHQCRAEHCTLCAHSISNPAVHLHAATTRLTLGTGSPPEEAPMTGIAFIAVGGVIALVLLAVLIGNADARAQREAWNRIARRRRELGEWERELIRAAESEGCPACRLLRERGMLHDPF